MRRTELEAKPWDPDGLTVDHVMENAVFTVDTRTSGLTIAQKLAEQNIGSIPVVEGERTLVGLVSEFDLLRAIDEGKDLRTMTASEMMSTGLLTVTEHQPLKDVIHLLRDRHLIRVPVVRNGRLVGLVARRDIVFGYVKAFAQNEPRGKHTGTDRRKGEP